MSYEGLDELLADHERYHSAFQIDHFITVRAGGTGFGMYRQALRELDSRRTSLMTLYLDLAGAQLDVEAVERKLHTWRRVFTGARSRLQIEHRRLELKRDGLERNIADTEREFVRFLAQARALKLQVGELTPERRAALDRELWLFELRRNAARDLICSGRITEGTFGLICSLPVEDRAEILASIKGPEAQAELVAWAEYCAADLPEIDVPELAPARVKELVCR